MTDLYLLLTPILMLGVVGLVGFVGCASVWDLEEVPDPDPTAPPENLTAMPGDMMVVLDWDDYSDAKGDPTVYHVKKSGGTPGLYDPDTELDASLGTSHTDRFVENGQTYTYSVTATVNGEESEPSNEVSATPQSGALLSFVTEFMLGNQMTGVDGWIGMAFKLGPEPVTVKTLGRIRGVGNSGTRTLKIVDGVSRLDVPGSATLLTVTTGPANEFMFEPLASPVTLSRTAQNPEGEYFVVSQETAATSYYNADTTTVKTTDIALSVYPVYGDDAGSYVASPGFPNYTYGPLNFEY
jgi:hypothetical protein